MRTIFSFRRNGNIYLPYCPRTLAEIQSKFSRSFSLQTGGTRTILFLYRFSSFASFGALAVVVYIQNRRGHGKITFKKLGQTIAARWKTISNDYKAYCTMIAQQDRVRFERELKEYRETRKYLRYMARQEMLEGVTESGGNVPTPLTWKAVPGSAHKNVHKHQLCCLQCKRTLQKATKVAQIR